MIKSYSYGHKIEYINNHWQYVDTKELLDLDNPRSCKRCGRLPTKEGYDNCLGYIKGVIAACCGHGVEEGYILRKE